MCGHAEYVFVYVIVCVIELHTFDDLHDASENCIASRFTFSRVEYFLRFSFLFSCCRNRNKFDKMDNGKSWRPLIMFSAHLNAFTDVRDSIASASDFSSSIRFDLIPRRFLDFQFKYLFNFIFNSFPPQRLFALFSNSKDNKSRPCQC